MRKTLLALSFLVVGASTPYIAVASTAETQQKAKTSATAKQKKATATAKKKASTANAKILPMKEYVDNLMARMTLQEKIGQLNLMVADRKSVV